MGFLTGKTAIITGAGRAVLSDGRCGSIGYGIATAYAKEGANLVITGRNVAKLEAAKEELEKKLLPRGLIYSGSAAVVYLAVYPILNALFGVDLLALGIYLPMLVVEPLLIYRFGRVQETMQKAVSKGLRITLGYVLLLLLLGCVREWMALGTVFGLPLLSRPAVSYTHLTLPTNSRV